MVADSSVPPLTSRQRVLGAINHQPVDRVPVDLGGTACSGAQVSVVARLRQALGLDKPGHARSRSLSVIKCWVRSERT